MKNDNKRPRQRQEKVAGHASRREFLATSAGMAVAAAVPLLPNRAFAAPGSREAAEVKEVERWNRDRQRKLLLKGGCVLSLDPKVGDFVQADVLIEGSRIVQIAPHIRASAQAIDARGTVVLPGLIDTHRHCWQNYFRRAIPNGDALSYMNFTHFGIARVSRPQDDYVAGLISGLGAINSGVTCMLDYHNSRSPEHTDAALKAHSDSGIRAVLGYCRPGEGGQHWPQDIRRVRRNIPSSADQLITLSLGVVEFVREQYVLARELGLRIIHDGAMENELAADTQSFTKRLEAWASAGLLGPDVTLIHGTAVPDRGFQLIKSAGSQLSLAATSDAQLRGLGDSVPPIQKALDAGLLPGLSVDVEVSLSTDLFSQMRAVFCFQRMLANQRWSAGDANAPKPMSVQQVLRMATVGGAMCNGVQQQVGTLTPGKQADIIMIEADDIMNMPLNNAYGTVVLGADVSSVRNVLIAGQIKKWQHRLVGVDIEKIRRLVHESRDYVAEKSQLWSTNDIIGYGPLFESRSG